MSVFLDYIQAYLFRSFSNGGKELTRLLDLQRSVSELESNAFRPRAFTLGSNPLVYGHRLIEGSLDVDGNEGDGMNWSLSGPQSPEKSRKYR